MKCAQYFLWMFLLVLSAATVAFGTVAQQAGQSADPCPAPLADFAADESQPAAVASDWVEQPEADASDRLDQPEEADHFDRGDEMPPSPNPRLDGQSTAESGYRYEYPDDDSLSVPYGKMGMHAEFGEPYYHKYGYQFADPAQKYGYHVEPAAPQTAPESAPTEESLGQENPQPQPAESEDSDEGAMAEQNIPVAQDESDATDESEDEAAEEMDDSSDFSHQAMNASDVPAGEESETDSVEHPEDDAMDVSDQRNPEEMSESDDSEAELVEQAPDYRVADEPADEQSGDDAREIRQPNQLEPSDQADNDASAEMPQYQYDGYHPRYGFDFGYGYRYEGCQPSPCEPYSSSSPGPSGSAPQAGTVESSPSGSSSAANANSSHQPAPSSAANVEQRYGYPEYMGEDYLNEANVPVQVMPNAEDSQPAATAQEEPSDADETRMTEETAPQAEESSDAEESLEDESDQFMDAEAGMPTEEAAPTHVEEAMPADVEEETRAEVEEAMPTEPEEAMPAEPEEAVSAESEESSGDQSGHSGDFDAMESIEDSLERESVRFEATLRQTDEYVGNEVEQPSMPSPSESEGFIELFAYHPTELLTTSDQDLLKALAALSEEPSSSRRAALNGYLETQGMEAVDFASQFEETTGIVVLGLADDLPGAAALLAAYRLVERGAMSTDAAVDMLRRALQRFDGTWLQGVSEITANAYDSGKARAQSGHSESSVHPEAGAATTRALWTLVASSVRRIGRWAERISDEVWQADWSALIPQIGLFPMSAQADADQTQLQR